MGLKLRAEVGLDGSGFERGLHNLAHSATHNFKSLVIGAFGVYSIHQALEKTVESAEELVTASKRLDVTIEQLQVLRQAAKENGVEFGKLETAFEKIDVAREKALGGGAEGKKALAAFAGLGVDKNALQTQTAAQLLMGPMHEKAGFTSAENLAGPMKEIFAKGFGELTPILKTNFDELAVKMKHLGSILDAETAVSIKNVKDEFDLLANIAVAQLGPALVQLTYWILQQGQAVRGALTFWQRLAAEEEKRTGEKPSMANMVAGVTAMRMFGASAMSRPGSQGFLESVMSAADAGMKVSAGGFKELEDLKARMAAEAARLNNPLAPTFEATPAALKKLHHHQSEDSLLRVGNFLGSGSIQDKHLKIAAQSRDYLKIIATRTERNFQPDSDTVFPLV